MAVCLLPGTELAFSQDAECDHPFARLFPAMRFGSIGARLARFRRINQGLTNTHQDALEFANGRVVLLTKLRPGQRAKVLQLPAQADPDKKPLEAALIDVVLSDAGAAASFVARRARRRAGIRQAIEGATAGERK
jgi:hypothetical protein